MKIIKAIPTNIITGFLGVGKTTAISQLLANKPQGERWAVLVNEFGEIGLDSKLLSGQFSENNGVFIREVAGGCMCCVAGVPMQVALKNLLKDAKPNRLLIEPTGLGHPKEMLKVLKSEYYRQVIDLRATIVLVDARQLSDRRYINHATFNQQIDIAEVVVGNKADLYQKSDKANLQDYLTSKYGSNKHLYFAQQGQLDWHWLNNKSTFLGSPAIEQKNSALSITNTNKTAASDSIAKGAYRCAENSGEGFYSIGWHLGDDFIFDHKKTADYLTKLSAKRIKAVLSTNQGTCSYNIVNGIATIEKSRTINESRIEIIFATKAIYNKKTITNALLSLCN